MNREIFQQNPVIYIFLCDDKEIPSSIALEQTSYFYGIKYVILEDNNDELLANINNIHEGFIKEQEYKIIGTIRINYLYSCKINRHLLFDTIDKMENLMSKLYPGGITTDVYVILDELTQMSSDKLSETISSLLNLKENLNMIYIMSHINSNGVLTQSNKANIIQSISKLFIIKDVVSMLEQNCIYEERYFREDSLNRTGDFFTAGCSNIKLLYQEILNVVTCRVISNIIQKTVSQEFIWQNLYAFRLFFEEEKIENLYGIAVNKKVSSKHIKTLTHKEVIEKIFSLRLYSYFDMNFEVKENQKIDFSGVFENIICDNELNVFAVYNSIKEATPFNCFLKEQITISKDNLIKYKNDLEKWLCNNDDTVIAMHKSVGFYKFAKIFIDKKINILNEELRLDTLIKIEKELKVFINNTHLSVNSLVEESENIRKQTMLSLSKKPTLLTTNLIEYYNSIADDYITDNIINIDSYLSASSKRNGSFFEYIKIYCSNNIIDYLNNISIDEEVKNRFSFAKISDKDKIMQLLECILMEKNFNLNIKSEDKNKQVEITLILDKKSEFAKYINYCNEKSGSYKISAAFVENKKDLDIIYQMGTFKIDELYYSQLLT